MVISKQHIITFLLDKNSEAYLNEITIPQTSNQEHRAYLLNGLKHLYSIQKPQEFSYTFQSPNWDLPELLMPSFEKAMVKSAESFYNIDNQLFKEFYDDNVCGILIHRFYGTIVYGFGENRLYVWLFKTMNGISVLYNYFYIESASNNMRRVCCCPSLMYNPEIYKQAEGDRDEIYSCVANLLILYLAVKKYADVETIIVPNKEIKIVEDIIEGKKKKDKVKNDSGQEVIIMDSRWFVKIINDNDISVRGFFRQQNKKNENGEWYKERIFVNPFVRHGYHRKAKIEGSATRKDK